MEIMKSALIFPQLLPPLLLRTDKTQNILPVTRHSLQLDPNVPDAVCMHLLTLIPHPSGAASDKQETKHLPAGNFGAQERLSIQSLQPSAPLGKHKWKIKKQNKNQVLTNQIDFCHVYAVRRLI